MKISVVRHGQTTGNIGRIVESRIGGKLTEKGIAQAKETSEKLRNERFDAIFCSDMQRCIDTAGYIRTYHPKTPFFIRDDIREMDKGIYNGGSWDDLPEYINTDKYIQTKFEEGESWTDVENRVRRFVDELYGQPYEHVLVVTHDGVLKAMHAIFESLPLVDAIKIYHENATVYQWQINKRLV